MLMASNHLLQNPGSMDAICGSEGNFLCRVAQYFGPTCVGKWTETIFFGKFVVHIYDPWSCAEVLHIFFLKQSLSHVQGDISDARMTAIPCTACVCPISCP